MKRRFLLSCGLILTFFCGITALPARAEKPDTAAPAKPKIIILPARVTLDGTARPDIGQSLSDIISARLLTSSGVELLDADTAVADPVPPPAKPSAAVPAMAASTGPAPVLAGSTSSANPNTPPGPAAHPAFPPTEIALPAPTPIATGLAMGADLVVQPTIVGHGQEFRLTLREIQVPGGKVVSIITEKTSTGLKGLYALAENHALRLVPALPPGPRQNAGPAIIDHPAHYRPTPPATPPVSEQEIAQAPPALEKLSAAKQAAIAATLRLLDPATNAAGPTPIGRIGGLDASWSFCEITLKQPLDLPPGTALFTTAGGNPENVINLRITRLEGRKIIADFAPGPAAAGLRSGDIVYYWKP